MAKKDTLTTIEELKQITTKISQDREWGQFHSPKNIAIDISVEANELLEKFTWNTTEESYETIEKDRQEIENELADVLYGVLMFADKANIDLTSAFLHKVEEIKAKYPIEKSRGKNLKYNEL